MADEGKEGHSKFAYILIKALRQYEKDEFTAEELANYVKQAVAGTSDQVPQYSFLPNSGHEWGDFVFSRRAKSK